MTKKVTREEVIAMLKQGLSVKDIAKKTGHRVMTIRTIAESINGHEVKQSEEKDTRTKQEIIFDMLDKGMSVNEVHKKVGGSKASIYTYNSQWKKSKETKTEVKESEPVDKKSEEKDLSYYIKQNEILRKKNEELAEQAHGTDQLVRKMRALTDQMKKIETKAENEIEKALGRVKQLSKRNEELIAESDKRIDHLQQELQKERIRRTSLIEYIAVDLK